MFDTLGGLPAHPLFVHLPVALVPLAAIGAVCMAVRPQWRQRFGVPVAIIAGVGFIGTLLAASTGEALEEDFTASGQTISEVLKDHAEMGETARLIVALFFFLTLAWVVFSAWQRRVGDEQATAKVRKPRLIGTVLAVVVVLSGVFASASVMLTGHNGAKSVWETDQP